MRPVLVVWGVCAEVSGIDLYSLRHRVHRGEEGFVWVPGVARD